MCTTAISNTVECNNKYGETKNPAAAGLDISYTELSIFSIFFNKLSISSITFLVSSPIAATSLGMFFKTPVVVLIDFKADGALLKPKLLATLGNSPADANND